MPRMKHLSIALLLGSALTMTACGKDKKPATTEPAQPAAADPAAPAAGSAETPAPAAEAPKAADKPASGGW